MKKYFLPGLLAILVSPALAFEINGQKWPGGHTHFYVDIGGSSATNITWNAAFTGALTDWTQSTDFDFTILDQYRDPCASDGVNGVDFTADVCGTEYGTNTLAVTVRKFISQVLGPPYLVEADIVVNEGADFDIFDGDLVQFGKNFAGVDFRRVALHELGHTIGLDHEQFASAIMAPNIGNLDRLTEDDIEGVNTLYGGLENCVIRPLSFGISNGSLLDGDCTVAEMTVGGEDTSYIDVYQFSVGAVTNLEFDMTSPVLDSVLLLADADLRYLGFDDKTSGDCNSRLRRVLQPGSYFLLANTFDEPPKTECGNTGEYFLDTRFLGTGQMQLGGAVSLEGGSSSASFEGGVTANNGINWGNKFSSTDSLDIQATIYVDSQHQDQPGFLIVAAVIEGQILLLNEQRQFVTVAAGGAPLTRAVSKVLGAVEEVEIATDLVPASLGIDSITVDFVVGYGVESNPEEVYFHQTPINLIVVP